MKKACSNCFYRELAISERIRIECRLRNDTAFGGKTCLDWRATTWSVFDERNNRDTVQ